MGCHSASYLKNIVIIGLALYAVDYIGILKHWHEIDYVRYFYYPSGTTVDYNYSFINNASDKCGSAAPKLTIIIKSALANLGHRNVIRRTWGYEHRFSDVQIRRIFLLGSSSDLSIQHIVANESSNKKDIVQIDFLDVYFNNTIKTVMGMQWALNYCANISPNLYPRPNSNTYVAESLKDDLYAGFVLQTAPHRHKFSKWYVPLSEYPFNLWPPYVTAGAFILNRNALMKLYKTAMHLKQFRFDDVFLGIAALKSDLKLKHCDFFYFNRPKYKGPQSFQFVIASHGFQNDMELEKIWNECRSSGFA
ncbi:beta-1,3-galactosyltransferase brn-like [Eurosta solidaginis]|uniref:beta-1,3-galactosyltransferase brn-like n=1 Tax=Eurosta solidaginis TaxID=178769 RepID=UPI003530F3C8